MIKKIMRLPAIERLIRRFVDCLSGWLFERGSYRGIVLNRILPDGTVIPYDYMDRFFLIKTPWFGVFLHRFRADDPDRFHDHPWVNVSILLAGSYRETFHDGTSRIRRAGDVVVRPALMLHRITDVDSEPISLFIRFRRKRQWGEIGPDGWHLVDSERKYKTKGVFFPRLVGSGR